MGTIFPKQKQKGESEKKGKKKDPVDPPTKIF